MSEDPIAGRLDQSHRARSRLPHTCQIHETAVKVTCVCVMQVRRVAPSVQPAGRRTTAGADPRGCGRPAVAWW
jgi:hypothetical protein